MNSFQQPNLVHESEAQRQYVRVRLPASLHVGEKTLSVSDLSAGGFLVKNAGQHLAVNKVYQGQLSLDIDGFGFTVPVTFKTLDARADQGLGCRFEDLEQPTADALRHILTAFLAGDVVTSGDMLHTLNRSNVAKERNTKKALAPATTGEKLASLLGTLGLFAVGLLAFVWVVTTVIGQKAVQSSSSARVAADVFDVAMPAAGMVKMMVAEDVKEVTEGQILATYAISDVKLDLTALPPETRELLSTMNVPAQEKSIFSPCDCYLIETVAEDGQFLPTGKPLFRLLPKDRTLAVEASFSYEASRALTLGQQVPFTLHGESSARVGEVVDLVAAGEGQVTAVVIPEEALPLETFERPAQIVLAPKWLPGLSQ